MRKTPVQVTCISVFERSKNRTLTFSNCNYGNEKSLMDNFAKYLTSKTNRIFVGWNIKGVAYGPQVLDRRFNELAGQALNIVYDNWVDFDDVLKATFGPCYVSHPKLANLCKLNDFNCQDFRTGEDEIELSEKGRFRDIELSTNRKVILLNDIFQSAISNKLKTERPDLVFVVHGHDEQARNDLKKFLTDYIGVPSVLLFEKPDEGMTIVEKLERYANQATLAVILLTPDDRAVAEKETSEIKRRARQNVILEMGYFWGKLGRRQVILLYKEGVEIPSDIYGILCKPFNKISEIIPELAQEIKVRLQKCETS